MAVDALKTDLAEVQKKLGLREGFDAALEMSGSPAALDSILASMCHGGKIAMLGISRPPSTGIRWSSTD